VNYLVNCQILACFLPFLTKTVITWDVLFRSELVTIRGKSNKHSYGLWALEIFLIEEIIYSFRKILLKRISIRHLFYDLSTEFSRNRSKSTFFNTERHSRVS